MKRLLLIGAIAAAAFAGFIVGERAAPNYQFVSLPRGFTYRLDRRSGEVVFVFGDTSKLALAAGPAVAAPADPYAGIATELPRGESH